MEAVDSHIDSRLVYPIRLQRQRSSMHNMRSMIRRFITPLAVAFALGTFCFTSTTAEDKVRFNRDIRPILAANCFQCHGPDENDREADLRLDEEEGIKDMFAGSLDDSEAWQRINSADPEMRMPPPESHRELKPKQFAMIRRWIEQGAEFEGHWSFIPPAKQPLPEVQAKAKVANPIDAFIIARLEKQKLTLGARADKEHLLRRIYMDLIGLPPTPAEIDTFLADTGDSAYENAVDRLLQSKHFGERMALIWMDAARYGDSSVFHADGPRDMWGWRDWVINAYNDNKPFDQFTVEQLAGDLLPDATPLQKVATGFCRNNATTDEGGAIAEEFRVEYAVDRVKTTSMIWMGLSLECAQCHNHKYDPITQQEYYQFYAYFNQASDPGMQTRRGNQAPIANVLQPELDTQRATLTEKIADLESQQTERREAAKADFDAWLAKAQTAAQSGPTLPQDAILHFALDENKGRKVADQIDPKRTGSIKGPVAWADGKHGHAFACNAKNFVDLGDVANFERTDAFSYGCWIKPKGDAGGAPIARMNDGNSFRGYDLHCAGGKVAMHIINTWPTNAIKVTTKAKLKKDQWQHVFVTYDGSSKASGIKIYFDGVEQPWDVNEDRLKDTIKNNVPLYLGRRNPGSAFQGAIDDVRVFHRNLSGAEVQALAGSDPIAPILAIAPEERNDKQLETLKNHFLNGIDKPYQELAKQLNQTRAKLNELDKPVTTVMVMSDVAKMRPTYILDRGNYASPLKDREVKMGVPAALPPLPEGATANRLGLAKWLVQPSHPLTARVTVNRYWHMLFGAGIVRTLEDFGAQGAWPTHPDLLDWLAVDFVESGWDIKRMLKMMVMSNTYQQSSRVSPELLQIDPENRLLGRGPRFRLSAELIRDNALAASGLLVPTIGGPSVKPYQPPGLWNEVSLSGNVRFVQDKGANLYRRGLYTYYKRSAPAPALTLFDAPTREKCVLRRLTTNTPLQALVTLNDVQFVEAARTLAQRALLEGGESVEAQIIHAYRLATGVRPSDRVLAILKATYDEELPVFKNDAERASGLLSVGESKRDESLDAASHAAMTVVTNMILNLDATVTRG